ncbi:MAG TPA: demethoxyubiquinone hydroxylase family protein [Falsiroseomonas sp.]|jgi:ubiquinone biosynthesis monooxygenase Coq7|nr:demethoxyubiquinone hydroxylase family protein [Falsiroseomonas sp.]
MALPRHIRGAMTHDRKPLIAPPLASLPPIPDWLVRELRSDHAGETGAVMIYRGILAVSRDAAVRNFAARHRATEQGHLDLLEQLLPPARRSKLLPIWKVAGFLTGALPSLFGPRPVHVTIDAVETFVDHHYQQQLDRLDAERIHPEIRALLAVCQAEEVEHRDEARELSGGPPGSVLRLWGWIVGNGSAAAVVAAKRV